MMATRTVIDTGVAVSALLLPRSTPRKAFDHARACGPVLVSADTLVELDEVLRRPKFNAYLPEDRRLEFLAALIQEAEFIDVTEQIKACRDPRDDKFLELAMQGHATHIISGDADLLDMKSFRGIAILPPQDFLALVKPADQ